MKCKKEYKAFPAYNCLLSIDGLNHRIDYEIFTKMRRIKLNNVHRYGGRRRWFPYKNLKLA